MSVTIEGTTLTCKRHPKYTAVFMPKSDAHCPNFCAPCWDLYAMRETADRIEGDLEALRNQKDRFAKEYQP